MNKNVIKIKPKKYYVYDRQEKCLLKSALSNFRDEMDRVDFGRFRVIEIDSPLGELIKDTVQEFLEQSRESLVEERILAEKAIYILNMVNKGASDAEKDTFIAELQNFEEKIKERQYKMPKLLELLSTQSPLPLEGEVIRSPSNRPKYITVEHLEKN